MSNLPCCWLRERCGPADRQQRCSTPIAGYEEIVRKRVESRGEEYERVEISATLTGSRLMVPETRPVRPWGDVSPVKSSPLLVVEQMER